jgi:hypothetical protein
VISYALWVIDCSPVKYLEGEIDVCLKRLAFVAISENVALEYQLLIVSSKH